MSVSNPPNTPQSPQTTTTVDDKVTKLIQTYLEGLHNPRDDQLYNELRAKRDTEALKAAIAALIRDAEISEAVKAKQLADFHGAKSVAKVLGGRIRQLTEEVTE